MRVTVLLVYGLLGSFFFAYGADKTSTPKKTQAEALPPPEPSREESILRGHPSFSYATWLNSYQPRADLSRYFPADLQRAPEVDRSVLEGEWKMALPLFLQLKAHQDRQESFVRGDFEKPEVRDRIRHLLRLSLLRLRLIDGHQLGVWLSTEGKVWETSLFALAFDEATAPSLRASVDLRFELWRELLRKAQTRTDLPWAEFRSHLDQIQLAWPIDRIVVAESRRLLAPAAQQVANGIGIELQKNPRRSIQTIRQRLRGGKLQELKVLDEMWTDQDVQRMNEEQKLLQDLRDAVKNKT